VTPPCKSEPDAIREAAAAWLASDKPCAFIVIVPPAKPGQEPLPLCGMQHWGDMDEASALVAMAAAGGRSLMRTFAIATCRPEAVEGLLVSLDEKIREISEGMVGRSQFVTG
jgi:hypothetical protein